MMSVTTKYKPVPSIVVRFELFWMWLTRFIIELRMVHEVRCTRFFSPKSSTFVFDKSNLFVNQLINWKPTY